MCHAVGMSRHHILLSEQVTATIQSQVKNGRYKDFSAAVQDAAWNYFVQQPTPFAEYGVTPAEVEKSAQTDLTAIRKARAAGRLKQFP